MGRNIGADQHAATHPSCSYLFCIKDLHGTVVDGHNCTLVATIVVAREYCDRCALLQN
jgi:hypothetical protein